MAGQTIRSALTAWLVGWASWVTLCFAWALCWLTVVLGPPATFGLVYAGQFGVNGVVLTLRETAAGARQYFLQSWLWMAGNLLAGAVLLGGHALTAGFPSGLRTGLRLVLYLLALGAFILQSLAPAYLMVQDRKSLPLAWRNGWRVLAGAPWFTLEVGGFALLVALVSLVLVAPLVVGGPALLALLADQAVVDHPDSVPILDE